MVWHEATVRTQAEITTVEIDADMIRASRCTINHFSLGDRVKLLKGPAAGSIETRTYWTQNRKALDGFCKFCKTDPRIDVVLLPVYDGLTLIKLKSSL
ncbi:hypothetical protein PpBr36_05369 [Pyricularia pennisetigena]|uniref:hypothetical protein n=1 Tax=Pyricularia pennisetigena TaxID=1578925 RepID=UPI00114F1C12|nr:hypothetical protein PpBr36_05369 [Pyricularia pennisetigena]TLS26314.1 hypothetical protein PpBr36_05369 [Pyricularia pennisetigena]